MVSSKIVGRVLIGSYGFQFILMAIALVIVVKLLKPEARELGKAVGDRVDRAADAIGGVRRMAVAGGGGIVHLPAHDQKSLASGGRGLLVKEEVYDFTPRFRR